MPGGWRVGVLVLAVAAAAHAAPVDVDDLTGVVLVECETQTESLGKGRIVIEVHPGWAPLGAERFLELVRWKYYDSGPLFRVVKGFLVQFGAAVDPKAPEWKVFEKRIQDDPNLKIPLLKGYVSFAGAGPNSRTTQVFITYGHHKHLGQAPWETPFGRVIEGMEHVEAFNGEYGDIKAFNKDGVDTGRLSRQGDAYIREHFPRMSHLGKCFVVDPPTQRPATDPSGAAEGDSLPPMLARPGDSDPPQDAAAQPIQMLEAAAVAVFAGVALWCCHARRHQLANLCTRHAKDT
eukprot:TRINITY_DN9162_c0_g1_i1.p1 TRINITY_DN9162_c0_g1~~TRINITY_DN9162_c0_g1_i1.p1  ORF type:complete len:291 (+),score=103.60 TRINITY_DN9162_c0_g1_i1:88-960(+)